MPDPTKAQIVLAREHLERREIDRAEQLLLEVLGRSDRFADVHHLLALVARERGDFVRAAQCLEQAIAINPRYTEALLALAITYNDLGHYDASRAIRERLGREQLGREQLGREQLGREQLDREQSGTAQPHVGPAGGRPEDLDPFVLGKIANQHADLAQAYRDAGCFADATRELERAVALRPTFVDLRVRLASVLRDAGRGDAAIAQLEDACARNPRYVEAHVQLGLATLAAAQRGAARRAFQAALDLEPDHDRARTYARFLSKPGPGEPGPGEPSPGEPGPGDA